ncbi:flagellar protein FliS [Sporosarcina saromensis]|uniref:Flagellar protein FliS n=2 Tax=Sporosarcina saromensis TaxID=359365 RepID=A0ABU4G6P3_9BACL|nr:flagellar protein FliS [Sporosarcina saromensis]
MPTSMEMEKAIQIYKEASTSTLSMMEYVLLLLSEMQKYIQQCQVAIVSTDNEERDRTLSKAQDFLFEIMTTTNQETVESERLMTLYIHMNQCLVKTRMTQSGELLPHIEQLTAQLIESWQIAKQVTRRRTYKTDQL